MQRWKNYLTVAGILLLAAYLRWFNVGIEPLATDDSVISLKAIGIARYGQWPLIGPVMSVGFWHSPLTFYLYAIPYSLSLDPRIARLFTGAANVVAVALVYFIGRRFFSRPAGLIAALLCAVHPEAVTFGRNIWNPNLGAPFVLLYVATGLLGYYHDRRWARIVHLPMLSLGVQCHPGAALLAPITGVLVFHGIRRRPSEWRSLIGHTALSGVLGVLTVLPWAAGLYLAAQQGGAQAQVGATYGRGFGYTFRTVYEGLGYWRRHYSQIIVPALVVLGSLWLVARSLRRKNGLPGLVVVLGFFLVPVLTLVLDAKFRGQYLTSSYPNVFLILGALIGGVAGGEAGSGWGASLWNWRGLLHTPVVRWIVPPLVSLIMGLHLIYAFTPSERIFGPHYTLDEQMAAIALARRLAAETGREALLLADSAGPPYAWELLNAGQSSRVIWRGRSLPLQADGAVMVGFASDDSWPFIFTGGRMFGRYFRIVDVPPASHFQAELAAPRPIRLANGASIIGILTRPPGSLPAAGQPWTIYLLWRLESPIGEDFTIFVHLINARGDKYAQLDIPGLPAGQQRAGEYVLSPLTLPLGDGLPATGPLYLRVGMYDDTGQFGVLDGAGQVVGDYDLIQIRGQAEPETAWQGLVLDDLTVQNAVPQGPPVEVTATWRVVERLGQGLHLRWRLLESGGAVAFEQTTDISPPTPAAQLPVGAFATERYSFRVPTDLKPGEYRLELQPVGKEGQAQGAGFEVSVTVTARERRFALPAVQTRLDADYGAVLRLLGYDSLLEGKTLRLTLYWQAIGQIEHDYKYFVHAWHDNQVVAQADSMPAGYQYPTSWWAPNEVFSDTVSLDLSALDQGHYRLTTGFYDPGTGERLPVRQADGQRADDWVILGEVTLK